MILVYAGKPEVFRRIRGKAARIQESRLGLVSIHNDKRARVGPKEIREVRTLCNRS